MSTRVWWASALALFLLACGNKADTAEPKSSSSAGGEPLIDRAERNLNEGQQEFQEAVEPAAEFVDEKAREAVSEGKKAFRKVTGTESSGVSGGDRQADGEGAAGD